MNNCNICNELSGIAADECGQDYQELVQNRKNIVLASANFVVVPSVGPLNKTHTLLVPVKHVNSFAELSNSALSEASGLLSKMQDYVTQRLGQKLFFFESGAGRLTKHSGACVTHAHIHCISESPDFFNLLLAEAPLQSVPQMDFSTADTNHGYIWFRSSSGDCYICNRPLLPSQFLRYLYAKCANNSNNWNWRRHEKFIKAREVVLLYEGVV